MTRSRNQPAVRTLAAINGLGGLELYWSGLRAALGRGWQLEVLDLPGHGERPPAPDYHYDALAEDALNRISRLAPVPLMGWSVGAAVAWLVAARRPEAVTALVLIEPAAPHQSPFRFGPVPEPVHQYTFASLAKARQALSTIDPSVTEEEIAATYRQNAAGRWEPRFDPAIYPAIVEDAIHRAEAIRDALSRVSCPVLIVRGTRSFIREAQIQELAALPRHVEVVSIHGAGHFIVKEQPAQLAAAIDHFLQ